MGFLYSGQVQEILFSISELTYELHAKIILQDTQKLWQHRTSPLRTVMLIITRNITVWFLCCSVFSWPFKSVQERCLLLLLKTNACRAVWVIVGEVCGSFHLRVFQAHLQTSSDNSSVHLAVAETRHMKVNTLGNLTNLRAYGLPLNFKVHLTFHSARLNKMELPQNMGEETK